MQGNDARWMGQRIVPHPAWLVRVKQVASVPNLDCVETVDSVKLALALDKACAVRSTPLSIMVQVNTSGEGSA